MIATDPLSLLFIFCFSFGVIYMLITALLGSLGTHGHAIMHHDIGAHIVDHAPAHIHAAGSLDTHVHADAHHVAHYHSTNHSFSILSILNPTSIVLFLLGFGFFGYVLHTDTSFKLPAVLMLAAISGLIIASVILVTLARIFGNSEATTIQDVSDRTGLLGKVNITIPEHGLGEILYTSPGNLRKSIPARSVDGRRLERDQEVVVVNYQEGIAEVDTWDHFVNQEVTSPALTADDDDLATLRALLEESSDRSIIDKNSSNNYVIRNDTQKE
jgi:hypothetical protein